MGMTRISDLVEKLSKSEHTITLGLLGFAQTLYLSVLKGRVNSSEIGPYIEEQKLLEKIPDSDREDFVQLLDLIYRLAATQ